MKFRKAFTIIELIFVIVILGVLGAVAIPHLAATRDDAKASALAYSVMTGVQEIGMYAVSQGTIDNSLAVMSNSMQLLEISGDAVLSLKRAVIKAGTINECVTLDINSTTADEVLQISLGDAGVDTICSQLQKMVHIDSNAIRLRGKDVVY